MIKEKAEVEDDQESVQKMYSQTTRMYSCFPEKRVKLDEEKEMGIYRVP